MVLNIAQLTALPTVQEHLWQDQLAAGAFSVALSGLTREQFIIIMLMPQMEAVHLTAHRVHLHNSCFCQPLIAGFLTAFGAQQINSTYGPMHLHYRDPVLLLLTLHLVLCSRFTYSTLRRNLYNFIIISSTSGSYSTDYIRQIHLDSHSDYSGNIPVGGGGASSINVAASGSGVRVPQSQLPE